MKEKVKKIAETIWGIWAAIAILFAIGILFGGLERFGRFGMIIFWTLIIVLIFQITHKDRKIITREEERDQNWKEKQKIMDEKMSVGEKKLTDDKLKNLRRLYIGALEEKKEQEKKL